MIVIVPLVSFTLGLDVGSFHRECLAAGLAVSSIALAGADVTIVFDAAPNLTVLNAVIGLHDAVAAFTIATLDDLAAAVAGRLVELHELRELALKTTAELDAEAAAVQLAIDAAPDLEVAAAIARAYTKAPAPILPSS